MAATCEEDKKEREQYKRKKIGEENRTGEGGWAERQATRVSRDEKSLLLVKTRENRETMAKKKRGTGSGKRSHRASTKITKTHRRAISLSRGDDLVWQDMQHSLKRESTHDMNKNNAVDDGVSHMYGMDVRDRKIGADDDTGLIRSSDQPLDDDLPGSGQYYCV